MTVKFTNGDQIEITEAYRVKTEMLACGSVEVSIYGINGEVTGRYMVGEAEGDFSRAYVMDEGKTIEVVRPQ